MSFTKNWYSKPTLPDMQFEERVFQTQFSISADKFYEQNIDGLSEQEIINKMSHMSMVGISYKNNHDLDQPEIVNLLVTSFSSTLRGWWDSYLIEDSKDLTVNDLQHEITIVKQEMIDLKNEFRNIKNDTHNIKRIC